MMCGASGLLETSLGITTCTYTWIRAQGQIDFMEKSAGQACHFPDPCGRVCLRLHLAREQVVYVPPTGAAFQPGLWHPLLTWLKVVVRVLSGECLSRAGPSFCLQSSWIRLRHSGWQVNLQSRGRESKGPGVRWTSASSTQRNWGCI